MVTATDDLPSKVPGDPCVGSCTFHSFWMEGRVAGTAKHLLLFSDSDVLYKPQRFWQINAHHVTLSADHLEYSTDKQSLILYALADVQGSTTTPSVS